MPHLITLCKNQKLFVSIKIKKQKPPLRIYFKPKDYSNFKVYVSRKVKFPDIDDYDSVYVRNTSIHLKLLI